MASSTLLGKIKEDTERCCGSILQAYFPEWPRNLVEHSGEMAMKGGDAILQWGQAVATYLSMDEYFQAISALHALQFREEVEDMTEYPHLQAMVQRMTDREKFYAIQQSRGMGLYPSDEMKFMHSLVKQISTKCRRKEMEVMEREQKKANEQASISNLAIVNKTVELELQMRASTLDLMMADHYNRQERGLKEKMKVWTDTLSPSLNKCLLQHILRSASNVILALYATQSFTSSHGPHWSGGDEGTSGALSSQDEQRNGEVRGVRGRVFGADHPLASEVCGVQVGPLNRPDPTIYTDCAENIEAAIRERIEKKQKPCTLTTEDRKRLGTFINTACGIGEHKTKDRTVFSKEKLEKVMQDLAHLGDMSKKWSVMRFWEAFQKLMRKYDPKFVLGAKIKIEPMGEGKAPRLLIADQDDGQICALLGMYAMEEMIFTKYWQRSIKKRSRKAALHDVTEYLNGGINETEEGTIFEGDGSSWDTCCNEELRDIIENSVLSIISDWLLKYHIAPEKFQRAHLEANTRSTLKLNYHPVKKYKLNVMKYVYEIAAIRRSGHRGTSGLNWWVNFTCWACAICDEPCMVISRRVTNHFHWRRWRQTLVERCVWGRWFNVAYQTANQAEWQHLRWIWKALESLRPQYEVDPLWEFIGILWYALRDCQWCFHRALHTWRAQIIEELGDFVHTRQHWGI